MALRLSYRSQHPKYRMAAVIFRGGRVLAHAVNSKRMGRHAEIRALVRDQDFSGATIVVARDSGGCSRPCRVCYGMIRSLGLRRMIFIYEGRALIFRNTTDDPRYYKEMYI